MGSSKIGVIDIGSNSFHMLIGGYINQMYYHITDDVKMNVRLCEGLNETGAIRQDRMDYGIQTLIMFSNICRTEGLDKVITVATEAVRRALNGKEFVRRAKEEAGIEIQVIPGTMEAELDYLGCANTLEIDNALMMDIGGGSAEFVLIKNRKNIASISLPFGSINLTEKFDLGSKVTEDKIHELQKYVKSQYKEIDFFQEAKGLPVIGVGGTIRNVARIHRRLIDYPLEIAHNYKMTPREVDYVVNLVGSLSDKERQGFDGLSKGRTDIFVAPANALRMLIKYIDAPELIISDCGLRDGLIYRYFGFGPDNLIFDIFQNSLINVMLNYEADMSHSYQVLNIVMKLYHELKQYLTVLPETEKVIITSCMLHDIGTKIAYRNHHEHSFYLILNSGLEGISQKELLLSAFIALYHRTNKKIRIDKAYELLLNSEDKVVIDEISLFLQIAENLDMSMDGAVKDIRISVTDERVTLHAISVNHTVFTEQIMEDCAKKFRRIFGRELYVLNTVVSVDDIQDVLAQENPF